MQMISPKDLENPKRASGYNYVGMFDPQGGKRTRPYQAILSRATSPTKGRSGAIGERGPRRATALESAWDKCNHVNGLGAAPTQQLKSAGHPGRPRTKAAAQAAKRARAKALKDLKGFVYLIGEESDDRYVKIGESQDHPIYRLRELQTGNPRKLVLLGFIQCSDRIATEHNLHMKHIKLNHLQEWFARDTEILKEFGL